MILNNVEEKTKTFLSRYIRNKDLKNDQDLFASGLVNSLFAMQLVLFVEKEFKVKVENADLDIKNFRSINSIVDLVQRKSNV